jgi:hypothetical protein
LIGLEEVGIIVAIMLVLGWFALALIHVLLKESENGE